MMHPARQAYVEEDAPEVSYTLKLPNPLNCVHMGFQRNADVSLKIPSRSGQKGECWLMGWLHVLGYGHGG